MSDEREKEKEILQYFLSKVGLDTPLMIQEAFLGYKYRKRTKKLYETDALIPTNLIKMYYSLNPGEVEFDNLRKSFINRYVKNESKLEGVNSENIHGREEIAGLVDMYEYLHSAEMEEDFNIYSLNELHKKLFSHTEFPECAGSYRNYDVYLPGTGIGLTEWSMIPVELYRISPRVDELHKKAKLVKEYGDVDDLLAFLDECVELNCDLIKIHPFSDGNGRTIRAFTNKMLEDAGLPSIYIKASERAEYQAAMSLALGEGDYSFIKGFYRYKVCDSIIELDINERLKNKPKELSNETKQKQKKYEYYFNMAKKRDMY